MRKNLKNARVQQGMTQEAVAKALSISLRYYQKIEAGTHTGAVEMWDALEDMFSTHQRILREISDTHHDLADSR